MTPEEITRTIAEWMGLEHCGCGSSSCCIYIDSSHCIIDCYSSLDSLQPVLQKFTPEMWESLSRKIWVEIPFAWGRCQEFHCIEKTLTIPASTLARLVAETIKETK